MNSHSRKKRNFTLATSCGVHGIQDGLYATIYVFLPVLASAFGLSYAAVGFIRAAYSSTMMLMQVPSGMLSERYGERILLVFGLICAGAGYLFLALATGIVTIIVSLLLAGLGGAFQHAPSSSIITATFRDTRWRAALGTYNASGDVGKLAFAGLFALAVGMGIDWQPTIAGFGAMALLSAGVVLVVLRHFDVGSPPLVDKKANEAFGTIGWGIRDRKRFAVLAVIVFLDLAVQSGFLTFIAFLMTEKEVPTGLAAFAVVLTLAGGVFGKLGCGFLAERMGVRRSLILVQCLTAAGVVAVLLSPPLITYFLLPLLGLVLQGSSSITYGTVSDLVQDDRQSRGFALIYSVSSAAAIVGPIIFGIIGDRFGLAPAMLAMALAVLLSLPLSVLLRSDSS